MVKLFRKRNSRLMKHFGYYTCHPSIVYIFCTVVEHSRSTSIDNRTCIRNKMHLYSASERKQRENNTRDSTFKCMFEELRIYRTQVIDYLIIRYSELLEYDLKRYQKCINTRVCLLKREQQFKLKIKQQKLLCLSPVQTMNMKLQYIQR